MLEVLMTALSGRSIRIAVFAFLSVMTLLFGPASILAIILGVVWLFGLPSNASSGFFGIGWGLLGLSGLLGLIAAWAMMLNMRKLKESPVFRRSILVGLFFGIAASSVSLVVLPLLIIPGNPAAWLVLASILVGILLFGAAISAAPDERSKRRSPRKHA